MALERAIAALDRPYREVLLLRDVEGLSAAEVAEVTGLSVPAVKTRLHRARGRLREALAPIMAPRGGGGGPGPAQAVPRRRPALLASPRGGHLGADLRAHGEPPRLLPPLRRPPARASSRCCGCAGRRRSPRSRPTCRTRSAAPFTSSSPAMTEPAGQDGRAFLASRKRPTRITKTANARRSRAGSRLEARRTPASAPSAAAAVKAAVRPSGISPCRRCPATPAAEFAAITRSDVPIARVDRQPGEEGEGGDDQEAAADAEKAGQEADAEARRPARRPGGAARASGRGAPAAPSMSAPTASISAAKRSRRTRGGDGVRRLRPERCPEHPRGAEEGGRAQVDPPGARVDEAADERGRAHDRERHPDGRVHLDPRHVHEHGHRQDRPAPAEEAERDADQRAQGEREEEVRRHRRILRLAVRRARSETWGLRRSGGRPRRVGSRRAGDALRRHRPSTAAPGGRRSRGA